jgi:nuclear pore complex protein Nup188
VFDGENHCSVSWPLCVADRTSDLSPLSSWKLVATALCDDTSRDRITSAAVSAFLRDGYVHQLVKTPSKVFEPPTPQSKAEFETKTAAINVTPTPNERYDIKIIKEDALWLSKNAGINEVAALRVVVIEFQTRPESLLTGNLTTQDMVNIQEAIGFSDNHASSLLSIYKTATTADPEAIWDEFETQKSRRQRLLTSYLSERRFFMSAADSLVTLLLHTRSGLEPLRQAVAKDMLGFDELIDHTSLLVSPLEELIPRYFDLLPACIEMASAEPATVEEDLLTEALQDEWQRTPLTEAVHAMSLAFQILDLSDAVFAHPDLVSCWFKFVGEYGFLDHLADVSTVPTAGPNRSA